MSFPNIIGMAYNKPSHVRDDEGNVYSKIELFHKIRKQLGPTTEIDMDYEQSTPSKEAAELNARARFLSRLEESSYNDDDFTDYVEVDGHIDRIEFCIINGLGTPKNYDEADELCADDVVNALIEFLTPFFNTDPESEKTHDLYAFPVWYHLTLSGL